MRDGGPVPGRRLDVRDIRDSLWALREFFHDGRADRDLTGPGVVVRASLQDQVGPSHETPARGNSVFEA